MGTSLPGDGGKNSRVVSWFIFLRHCIKSSPVIVKDKGSCPFTLLSL